MSLFVKVKDIIIRKSDISSACIINAEMGTENDYAIHILSAKEILHMPAYPTLKQARFALNKLHRDLEGETESW